MILFTFNYKKTLEVIKKAMVENKILLPQKAIEEFMEIYNDLNPKDKIDFEKAKVLAENFAQIYFFTYSRD